MKRLYYLDLLRIVAIFGVVLTHVSASFVVDYDSSSIEFILGNIFDSLSRMGVPLFLMISGTLMLDENREFRLKKSALRILGLFFVWSLLYVLVFSVFKPLFNQQSIDVASLFSKLFIGHYHLWYMWAILGLYLLTPILRCFVTKANQKTVLYCILLLLVFQFTGPVIELILTEANAVRVLSVYKSCIGNVGLSVGAGLVIYYLAGWYVSNTEFSKKQAYAIYALGVVGILGIILLTQCFPKQYGFTYTNGGILVFFYSLAIFVLAKRTYQPKGEGKLVVELSKSTFGVYVVHVMALNLVYDALMINVFFLPLVLLVTVLISFLFAFAISKIPFVKRLIKA